MAVHGVANAWTHSKSKTTSRSWIGSLATHSIQARQAFQTVSRAVTFAKEIPLGAYQGVDEQLDITTIGHPVVVQVGSTDIHWKGLGADQYIYEYVQIGQVSIAVMVDVARHIVAGEQRREHVDGDLPGYTWYDRTVWRRTQAGLLLQVNEPFG